MFFLLRKPFTRFLSRKWFMHFVQKVLARWKLPSGKFRLFGPLLHALHDLEESCLELLFWFTSMPLPLSNTILHSGLNSFPDRLCRIVYHISQTVSYWVSHFPGRLYRICNWQKGVGRFLGFLQVLMAVQWLLGTIWWSGLAQRETQKHRNTKHRMAVQWILGTVWWSRLAHRETQKPKAKTGLIIK